MRTLSGVGFAPNIDRDLLKKAIAKYWVSDKRVWAILTAVELRKDKESLRSIQTRIGQISQKLTPRRKRNIKRVTKILGGITSPSGTCEQLGHITGPSIGVISQWLSTAHKLDIKGLLKFAVDKRRK